MCCYDGEHENDEMMDGKVMDRARQITDYSIIIKQQSCKKIKMIEEWAFQILDTPPA